MPSNFGGDKVMIKGLVHSFDFNSRNRRCSSFLICARKTLYTELLTLNYTLREIFWKPPSLNCHSRAACLSLKRYLPPSFIISGNFFIITMVIDSMACALSDSVSRPFPDPSSSSNNSQKPPLENCKGPYQIRQCMIRRS